MGRSFQAQWHPAGRTFTPVERPPDSAGAARGGAADLVMQTRGSRFVKFQEVRIQELAAEVWLCPLHKGCLLNTIRSITTLSRRCLLPRTCGIAAHACLPCLLPSLLFSLALD